MGHDHHFLSRLDRVHAQHTELALSLYRDDELIRRILNMAEVPEAADRIAISLDDERRGPFIIVARNGHFVTCLGEGMGVKDAHVITRARLDGMSQYIGVLRERMECAKAMTGGEFGVLLDSILQAGDGMSRETFHSTMALSELLRGELLPMMYRNTRVLVSALATETKEKLRPNEEKVSRMFWCQAWVYAHLHLLCTGEWPPGDTDPLVHPETGSDYRLEVSRVGFMLSWMPVALRTVRTAAIAGPRLQSALEREWIAEVPTQAAVHSLCCLIGIARRDPGQVPHILSLLSNIPGQKTPQAEAWRELHHGWWPIISVLLDRPEAFLDRIIPTMRRRVFERGKELPLGNQARFLHEDEVPVDLAFALESQRDFCPLDMTTGSEVTMGLSTWAATAQPEDFYAPHDYLLSLRPRWDRSKSRSIANAMSLPYSHDSRAEKRASQKPNDPCACGSGKKFKRCCGSVVVS